MEATYSSKTFVTTYNITRCHNPEDETVRYSLYEMLESEAVSDFGIPILYNILLHNNS
jgi:hypothetical protein